ncbi:MAG: YggS family pyridoxal phosphate-dependent enzyme [Bacteroidota bacterium]
MGIKTNIDLIKGNLGSNCRLIAVSKTQPNEKILEAYEAGQRIFGENKVQELVAKYEALPRDIEWHLIGHLQTNKVKFVAPFVSLIHSVDSKKLLDEIDKQAKKINRVVPCLLQIHIAQEETKFGFDRAELMDLLHSGTFGQYTHVRILGLMGMASLTNNQAQVRAEFNGLKQLFDELKKMPLPAFVDLRELSMGMSGDYPIAVQEGSTLVRVGTAIFGERNYAV